MNTYNYNTAQMARTWRNEITNTGQANYLASTNTQLQKNKFRNS